MRAFLVVLAVLVGGFVALGFYRDWFHLTVNKDKMKEDTEVAKQKVEGLEKRTKDRGEEDVKKARGARTAMGRVNKVEAADNRFLMTTEDNEQLTMYTD